MLVHHSRSSYLLQIIDSTNVMMLLLYKNVGVLVHHSRSSYLLQIIDSTNVMMLLLYKNVGGRFTPAPPPPLDETLAL